MNSKATETTYFKGDEGHLEGQTKLVTVAPKPACSHVGTWQGITMPSGYCAKCGAGPHVVEA